MPIFNRKKNTVNELEAFTKTIGRDQIQKAEQIRQKYKDGKKSLEQRIIRSEERRVGKEC